MPKFDVTEHAIDRYEVVQRSATRVQTVDEGQFTQPRLIGCEPDLFTRLTGLLEKASR